MKFLLEAQEPGFHRSAEHWDVEGYQQQANWKHPQAENGQKPKHTTNQKQHPDQRSETGPKFSRADIVGLPQSPQE